MSHLILGGSAHIFGNNNSAKVIRHYIANILTKWNEMAQYVIILIVAQGIISMIANVISIEMGKNMVLESIKDNQVLQKVSATMAIENMYMSDSFMKEMIKVVNGEKATEDLRREVIKKYAR